jgi:hypothetical protein
MVARAAQNLAPNARAQPMKRGTRMRITAILLAGTLLFLNAGCGSMLRDSVKMGTFNWVTINLNAPTLANQLLQLIDPTFQPDETLHDLL